MALVCVQICLKQPEYQAFLRGQGRGDFRSALSLFRFHLSSKSQAPFRERNNFIWFSQKTYSVLYLQLFTDFQLTKLRPFKRSASVIFLKFHKFEPQYSYKICSHRKKKSVFCLETGVVFEKTTRVYERSLRKHPFLLTLRPWGFSIPHDSK